MPAREKSTSSTDQLVEKLQSGAQLSGLDINTLLRSPLDNVVKRIARANFSIIEALEWSVHLGILANLQLFYQAQNERLSFLLAQDRFGRGVDWAVMNEVVVYLLRDEIKKDPDLHSRIDAYLRAYVAYVEAQGRVDRFLDSYKPAVEVIRFLKETYGLELDVEDERLLRRGIGDRQLRFGDAPNFRQEVFGVLSEVGSRTKDPRLAQVLEKHGAGIVDVAVEVIEAHINGDRESYEGERRFYVGVVEERDVCERVSVEKKQGVSLSEIERSQDYAKRVVGEA